MSVSRTSFGAWAAVDRDHDPRALADAGAVRRYLDRAERREPGTKIQYGHPSPRFWRHGALELDELLAPLTPGRELMLYVHVPFCPPTTPAACGFCLFAREDFDGYPRVARYVDDLLVELDALAQRIGRRPLAAVYIGGGTPNVLKPRDVERLFAAIRTAFVVEPATEVTFEGTPALFTPDRLRTLVDVGVNRVSVGVQVLRPELVSHSGRQQTPAQVRATIEFCRNHGLHCSADLITGWFDQTAADVVDDVERLTEWGVTGIVNHPLTMAGDSVFARNRARLPPVESTRSSFAAARARLLELGFRADGYTDYRRAELAPVRYLELYRDLERVDRLGVGYGANSLFAGTRERPGHTVKNVASLGDYAERVRALRRGSSAVESRFAFAPSDLKLLYVLKGLEGSPWLSTRAYRERFGSDLRKDWAPWWRELERRGWLAWEPDGPRLAGDGVFFTSAIQRALAEPRNAYLRGQAGPDSSVNRSR